MYHTIGLRPRSPEDAPRGLYLIMAHVFDCDTFTLWCRDHVSCDAIESTADLNRGLDRCRTLRPQLLVLEPAVAGDAVSRAVTALREGALGHLLLLDSRPQEVHLVEILREPRTSYFSRAAGSLALAAAMEEIYQHDRRMFDPALASRVQRTSRGFQLQQEGMEHSVAMLSPREREVMRLLAVGNSVRQCAELLGLSESTIDNHKSRLMKKLGIHKSSELTRRAVRDGLISL